MEIITAFIIGFATMWFANNFKIGRTNQCPLKESMIDIVNTYPNNEKICNELKKYSFDKVKNGNFEYFEVIEKINRHKNDKTRT